MTQTYLKNKKLLELLVGENHTLLTVDDVLQEGDETACLSMLLSRVESHWEGWAPVDEGLIGVTVWHSIEGDIDANERILRRLARSEKTQMRRFQLVRGEDVHGVSGTGVVAEGVQYASGFCAITWKSEYASVTVFHSIDVVEKVHGHEGRTRVKWIDYCD